MRNCQKVMHTSHSILYFGRKGAKLSILLKQGRGKFALSHLTCVRHGVNEKCIRITQLMCLKLTFKNSHLAWKTLKTVLLIAHARVGLWTMFLDWISRVMRLCLNKLIKVATFEGVAHDVTSLQIYSSLLPNYKTWHWTICLKTKNPKQNLGGGIVMMM